MHSFLVYDLSDDYRRAVVLLKPKLVHGLVLGRVETGARRVRKHAFRSTVFIVIRYEDLFHTFNTFGKHCLNPLFVVFVFYYFERRKFVFLVRKTILADFYRAV